MILQKKKTILRSIGLLLTTLFIQFFCGTVIWSAEADTVLQETEESIIMGGDSIEIGETEISDSETNYDTEQDTSIMEIEIPEAEQTETSDILFSIEEDLAESADAKSIVCDVTIVGRLVTLTGQIVNAEGIYPITIFVGTIANPICIRQITTSKNGSFNFSFPLSKQMKTGNYSYSVGLPDDTPVFHGVFHYDKYEDPKNIQYSAEINGRTVVISGNVLDAERLYEVSVFVGTIEMPICVRQITTGEDGSFQLTFKVPENLPSGSYPYQIDINTNGTLVQGTLNYHSDQISTVASYMFYGNAGDEFRLVAKAYGQALITGRIFELSYNPEQIEFVEMYEANGIESEQRGNLEIISHENGKIKFQVNNVIIPEGKIWSGVLSMIKFRFVSDYSGQTTMTLQ